MTSVKQSAKALTAGAGALIAMLSQMLDTFGFIIPNTVEKPLGLVLAGLTMVLTWFVPNAPKTS